jgi:hypothetical protein
VSVAIPARAGLSPLLFGGTIFSSSFLLFLVQPLIAKQILPWFGGSAAVWTVCMVFFQVVLLAGYAYADGVARRLAPRAQAAVHAAVLVVSLASLPIVASARWKPADESDPTWWILGLLVATIGLPYFVLSTTGPLLQAWLARAPWAARVYRYFSLSNFASLLALLAYPVVIETTLPLRTQAIGWSAAYVAFVLLCLGSAFVASRVPARSPADAQAVAALPAEPPRVGPGTQWLWLALPALGSWLLLAVTNRITQHVASIPFLWILPLSTYLLTFILCFESDRWYRRRVFLPLAVVALLLGAFGLVDDIGTTVKTAVPLYVGTLFVLCMALHGETARLRPPTSQLTRFYLMLSAGGALGGIVVGLVAPQVLRGYYELGIAFVLTAAAAAIVVRGRRIGVVAGSVVALVCAGFLAQQVGFDRKGARRLERNFYGTLQTFDVHVGAPHEHRRVLLHGSVKHGEQYLDASRRREPTAYYGITSGIGRVLTHLPPTPARVGLVGLGAGTLATYGRTGDVYRIYEIDPQVFEIARSEFTFLADSQATLEDVVGDARLALEREPPQRFDVLAIDAFSGGSIPMHLLTTQAIQVYMKHLQPDGVLAFHLTNRRLDLPPVLLLNARELGLHAVLAHDEAEDSDLRRTDWVLVSRDAARLAQPWIAEVAVRAHPIRGLRPWTDDFNDLLRVLK